MSDESDEHKAKHLQHHAEPGQTVRGVIVAKEVTADLRLACRRLVDVRLFEYALSVSLRAVACE